MTRLARPGGTPHDRGPGAVQGCTANGRFQPPKTASSGRSTQCRNSDVQPVMFADMTPERTTESASFDGVFVPVVTPFLDDAELDLESLDVLCRKVLHEGAAGLVPLGTTGEAPALTADEALAVVGVAAQACREFDRSLIIGTGTNNTASTCARGELFSDFDQLIAYLVVAPYYVRPSEDGILAHYRRVAEASSVPILAYNVPYRTGRELSAQALIRLSEIPGVVGIKQAVGTLDAATLQLLAKAPREFSVLAGDDAVAFALTLMGGRGAIAASAHVMTGTWVDMIDCGLANDIEGGRPLAETLLDVVEALFAEPNPAVIKGVLAAQGVIASGRVREPMTPGSSVAVQRAMSAIDAATASS